ncbi:hypothetical protein CJ739_2672 [Mariniflexile rhizosphaerae]|uniref:hypothetical protein n=1 Tax=unclassified Mariniflexile TaxID=2643887 RepID=UPI000CB874D7|nr:hypothetical protein [Mariniflexile sp. TRM1-10]AXP81744.1 hypothetical protein CJ739_2672 [Mariniflexile sp. TRM1-10]PLB20874.1 MAG: hypothetical protein TRG1_442 [Flavobacteriaceae bacterium FS1-H7996/R]
MNKSILKIIVFLISGLTLYAQDLEAVLKADTIYVNINKGFSVHENKSKKSVHLPCFYYSYYDNDIKEGISFYTCKWLNEEPPEIKILSPSFLSDKTVIDLDFIKRVDIKIISRKFRKKIFYVIKDIACNKIELTEAEFNSTYSSVNDYKRTYIEEKSKE